MDWICEECGRRHPKNNPPCSRCGHMHFQKAVVRQEPEGEPDDGPPENPVWRCPECGREHYKNSPPCNRCGHMVLEAVEASPVEPDTGFDVPRRRVLTYGVAIAGVVGLGGYVFLTGASEPTISDVPGEADSASGIEFEDAEQTILDRINVRRGGAGQDEFALDPDLEQIATHHSKDMVKNDYYSPESRGGSLFEQFNYSCDSGYIVVRRSGYEDNPAQRDIHDYDSAESLGEEIALSWLGDPGIRTNLLDGEHSHIGIDIHVDETGAVYVTAVLC